MFRFRPSRGSIPVQALNGALQFEPDHLHQRVLEGGITERRTKLFLSDFLYDGRQGVMNRGADTVSDEIFKIVLTWGHAAAPLSKWSVWRYRSTFPWRRQGASFNGNRTGLSGDNQTNQTNQTNQIDETDQKGAPMSSTGNKSEAVVADLNLPLERDLFTRMLIRELSGTLQDVVGLEEASGFVSVVGQKIAGYMDREYKQALRVSSLTRTQVRDVLVDLKRRIQGDFYVIEESEEKIVLGNRRCPFGDKVLDRPALCMMTSNVFGSIAAENLGYAKVALEQTIAQGDPGCRVVVYLQPTSDAERADGREYFKGI
jgi:hypothetical protein